MKQSSKMGFLFFIASILSVLAFPFNPLIIFKVFEPNNIEVLGYAGWIFWVVGIALIILPYYHVYYRKVNVLVDSGIYAVVIDIRCHHFLVSTLDVCDYWNSWNSQCLLNLKTRRPSQH